MQHLMEMSGLCRFFCYFEKEYEVSLMLPVRVNNGEFNGILEGWFVLKRKCIFLFEIKEVGVYKNTLPITKEQ